MEQVFIFIHAIMPLIYIGAVLAVALKIVLVARYRAFDFGIIFLSFFRIYSISAQVTDSRRRKRYMKYNNLINIFLYASLLLFLITLMIYRRGIFDYS